MLSKRTNFDTISEAEIKHIQDCLGTSIYKKLNVINLKLLTAHFLLMLESTNKI